MTLRKEEPYYEERYPLVYSRELTICGECR